MLPELIIHETKWNKENKYNKRFCLEQARPPVTPAIQKDRQVWITNSGQPGYRVNSRSVCTAVSK